MKLFLAFLFTLNLSASILSTKQLELAKSIHTKGKEFDLGYTLVAIAWQESQLGLYKINLSDPSCGTFHIMPKSLIKRTSLRDTKWNRSRLCERLIADDDFGFSAALLELKYWENYWKGKGVPRVWSHMVSSYNGGFKIDIKTNDYLKAIRKKIKILKRMEL